MRRPLANIVICILALSVAIPESYARRLGGGRSVGRQTPAYRQRSAPTYQAPPRQAAPVPPPAYAPVRPVPDLARRSLPVQPNYARQGGSTPWGGMLGGALVGLGLGSLLSSHDRNVNNPGNGNAGTGGTSGTNADGSLDPNAPNQMSGTNENGATASGNGQATQPAEQPRSGFGSILLWGLLALVAFMLFRRARTRAARRL
jgi:hypothetical protein